MAKELVLPALAALFCVSGATAGENLIKNGDFEAGTATNQAWGSYADKAGFSNPNWESDTLSRVGLGRPDGTWVNSANAGGVGDFALFLQTTTADSEAHQTFSVPEAGAYRLSFSYMARPQHSGISTEVRLIHGDVTKVVAVVPAITSYMNRFSDVVQIEEPGEYTLQFYQRGCKVDNANCFDNVSFCKWDIDAKYAKDRLYTMPVYNLGLFDREDYSLSRILPNSATLAFKDLTLDQMTNDGYALYASFCGAWTTEGVRIPVGCYKYATYTPAGESGITKAKGNFVLMDGTTAKCVVVEFTQGDDGVYARAAAARYISKGSYTSNFSSIDANGNLTFSGTSATVATAWSNGSYGLVGLRASRFIRTDRAIPVWANAPGLPVLTINDIKDYNFGAYFAGGSISGGYKGIRGLGWNRRFSYGEDGKPNAMVVEFQTDEEAGGAWVKCVAVKFTNGEDGVYGQALRACYASTGAFPVGRALTTGMNAALAANVNDGSVTTAFDIAGYGIYELFAESPSAMFEIDGPKAWGRISQQTSLRDSRRTATALVTGDGTDDGDAPSIFFNGSVNLSSLDLLDFSSAGSLAFLFPKDYPAASFSPGSLSVGDGLTLKYGARPGNVFPSQVSAELKANNYLLHRWSFNGTEEDAVGSSDAVFNGAVSFTEDGKGVRLEGGERGTSWIDLGANAIPGGDEPFTIEVWTTYRAYQQWCRVFSLGNSSTGNGMTTGVLFTYNNASNPGTSVVALYPQNISHYGNISGTGTQPYDTEVHLALAVAPDGFGGSSVTAIVYDSNTGAKIGGWMCSCTDWSSKTIVPSNFWLGHSQWTADRDASAEFNEVRVWGVALSEAQIAANNALGPDELPELAAVSGEASAAVPSPRAIALGEGATLDFALNSTGDLPTLSNALTLGENSKIAFNTAGFVGSMAALATGGIVGEVDEAGVLSHIELSEPERFEAAVAEDFRNILITTPNLPVTALWTGAGADPAKLDDPANWTCRNAAGEVLQGAVPGADTTVIVDGNTGFTVPEGALMQRPATFRLGEAERRATQYGRANVNSSANFTSAMMGSFHRKGIGNLANLDGQNTDWQTENIKTSRVRFDGWFDVTPAKAGEWKIRHKFDDYFGFAVDGEWVLAAYTYAREFSASCYVSPGWHRFTIVCGDTGGGYGANGLPFDGSNRPMLISVDGGAEFPFSADDFTFGSGENSVTLAADCDWRQMGTVLFAEGVVLDLNGHNLKVEALSAGGYVGAMITNSSETVSVLTIDVPEGTVSADDGVKVAGAIKVIKAGGGEFTVATGMGFTGGLTIEEGILKPALVGTEMPLGMSGGNVVVDEGAVLDMNAQYDMGNYSFTLNGGILANSAAVASPWSKAMVRDVRVGADSRIELSSTYGLIGPGYAATSLDLGGNTLTFSGSSFYFSGIAATAGNVVIDNCVVEVYGSVATNDFRLAKVSVNGKGILRCNSSCATPLFGDYEVNATAADTATNYEKGISVYGMFTPNTDNFHGCELQNGATLDLRSREGVFATKGAYAGTKETQHTVTFANGANVTVALDGRPDIFQIACSDNPYIVTWAEGQTVDADFAVDSATRRRGFKVYADEKGLKLVLIGGTVLFIR